MTTNYEWVDDPTMAGVSAYEPDVLNECLMHLKYDIPNIYDSKIENCSEKDLSNVTTAGKERAVSWGMPDFTTAVDIPTTLDFVQYCDEDCYLLLNVFSVGYGFVQLCDVNGNDILTDTDFVSVLGGGVVSGCSISCMTPLLKKGTYFKFVYNNAGITVAKKIYRTGVLQQ